MNEHHRMRILLSIMHTPQQIVRKRGEHGEQFECLAHHFNGAGLLEVSSHPARVGSPTTFRFSKYGGLIGIFEQSAHGEAELLYDRDSGFGNAAEMQQQAALLLQRLARTITAKEEMNYYL